MNLDNLANELVIQIFHSCESLQDAINLASTSHRLHALFQSQKLPILFQNFEIQYGPLHDAIQLVTHNSTQPTHMIRTAPYSLALLKQLLTIGRTAASYESLYPFKKWKLDSSYRRLLTSSERYKLRRAIYRLWLYSRAFHNARYTRTMRTLRHCVLERSELLHNWSNEELAEMEDVRIILKEVVRGICPSNGSIQRKFRKKYSDDSGGLIGFNIHLNYPPPPQHQGRMQEHFHSYLGSGDTERAKDTGIKYGAINHNDLGAEGWGDEILHYYVVEDMLKLDPGQILKLRDHASVGWEVGRKGIVKGFVSGLGDWFENNGETFGQTLEWVMNERGEDLGELLHGIVDGERGVVVE